MPEKLEELRICSDPLCTHFGKPYRSDKGVCPGKRWAKTEEKAVQKIITEMEKEEEKLQSLRRRLTAMHDMNMIV
jgi:hypothetical protein